MSLSSRIPEPRIRASPRGPIFDFDGKWKIEYFDLVRKHQAVGIRAGFYLNEYETDFSFLSDLPHLQYFAAGIACPFSPEPIYYLKDLRYLWILNTHTMELDFTQFKVLEAVSIPWSEGMNSLFQCGGLRRLSLQEYRGASSDAWRKLKNLEAFDVRDCTVTEVEALAQMPKLRKLRLSLLPRLTSLSPMGLCDSLEVLHLGRCGKATDLSPVRYLQRLRYLILTTGKPVASLEFVRSLQNLRLFNFDCVVKDGDLGVLLKLPNLAQSVFAERRHYSHTSEDLQKHLTALGRTLTNEESLYGREFGLGIDNWSLC